MLANDCTSGLAAGIVTADPAAAGEFLDAYRGTGAFWNATTRLLDGFRLRGVPETGINVDHVPGPRGPVTFQDLCLRQYVVVPGLACGPSLGLTPLGLGLPGLTEGPDPPTCADFGAVASRPGGGYPDRAIGHRPVGLRPRQVVR